MDVHLQAGSSPQLRLGGLVRNVEGPAIDGVALRQFAASIAPQAIAEDLDGAMFRGAVLAELREPGAVPVRPVQPARECGAGTAGGAGHDPHARAAQPAAGAARDRPGPPRPDHRHRPVGLGQDGHPLGLGRPPERDDLRQDRHDRESRRDDLSPQEGPRRPARGRDRCRLDRRGDRAGDRPGRRRDRRRRPPRRRVRPPRPARGRDRAPGLRHDVQSHVDPGAWNA